MALNTLDAKLKKLRMMGGKIAPLTEEVLTHLIKQSQMQACESLLLAQDYDKLKRDLKRLESDNRLYFWVIISMWLALVIGLGVMVYYG